MTQPAEDTRPALRRRRPGWVDILAAGIAPGALAGVQLAGLIFFLNPGLPFRPAPVRGLGA